MLRAALVTCVSSLLLGATLPARAELGDLGGTVSVQSDARERGLSYSQDKPQAAATLSYDGSDGWYGGTLLTRARFDAGHHSDLTQFYAGRVVSLSNGLDFEAGLQYSRFPSISRYSFAEAYAGLLGARWNARLHFASDYYGSGTRTAYAEYNTNWPLHNDVQAVAHLGMLLRAGGRDVAGGSARYDSRLGLAWQLRPIELQLAWVAVSPGGPYTWVDERRRNALVLGVSASF